MKTLITLIAIVLMTTGCATTEPHPNGEINYNNPLEISISRN